MPSVQIDGCCSSCLGQAGDKINSNGITVAGWIESAFDEPTSQSELIEDLADECFAVPTGGSRVSGLPALIGLCSVWLVLAARCCSSSSSCQDFLPI